MLQLSSCGMERIDTQQRSFTKGPFHQRQLATNLRLNLS